MNKILLIMAFSIFGLSVYGQEVKSKKYALTLKTLLSHTVNEVSVNDIKSLDEYVILDAREWAEYEVSSLDNARFVGYDQFELSSVADVDKDSKILIYCSVGYRSEKIAEKLIAEGFQDVSNLYGGIFEWKNQGHQVVKDNAPTPKVHAFNKVWGLFLTEGEKVY